MVIRRASALKKILENMTVYIHDDEIIVGNFASTPFSLPAYPELYVRWLEKAVESEPVYKDMLEDNQKDLHTALDTAGFTKWDILKEVLKYVDLVLYDIKHIDSEKHREGTGVDNKLIIENAKKTASLKKIWIRMPIIPQYNYSKDVIEKIIEFAKNIDAEKVSLLPYHTWGKHKYEKLGIPYKLEKISSLKSEDIQEFIKNINNFGLEISCGR